jgi:lactate permease
MYEQVYEPIAGNLALSTLVAVIPILVLFVLLAGLRLAAQWASLITLAVALMIAVLVYGMPIDLALNSTLLGICFGLFPIVWIVINATFLKYKQPSRRKVPSPQSQYLVLQPL